MPAVPETKSMWQDGVDALDSTNLHAYFRDPLRFLMRRPAAVLRSTVAQSLTSGSWTAISWQVEDLDDDPDAVGGHSTDTNTTRYTARYPGWYRAAGIVGFAANATGRRGARWLRNGSIVVERYQAAGVNAVVAVQAPNTLIYLGEGDYLELQAYQDSGGALATVVSATWTQPTMSVSWERLGAGS